ncbi:hypothetical protein N9P58_01430 [Puniceicoccaceae bacterium]|nr:hypothetical protein [Puniceicoccaceae bacterium]
MNPKNPLFSAHPCLRVYRLRATLSPFVCFAMVLLALLAAVPAVAQGQSNDVLLVSVGESAERYSDVAVHLQGLLAGTSAFSAAQVDMVENSTIESLADGYYDQNTADKNLRAKVVDGYGTVILIPTIITTPTGTVEYSEYNGGPTNVYDDAPFDNEYFAPEVFYEGCTQFSKLILNAGATPMIFLPDNADEVLSDYGPIMYRVANGVGMQLIPGAYALDVAGSSTGAEEDYLYACAIFTQLTGLNASASTYSPAGIVSGDATTLGNTAETTVNAHVTTEHYTSSYENEGAVVYRSLDVTQAPFNDVVRYMYKGSSTHDWTSDALTLIINSNSETTKAARKLGTRNGETYGTRYWHPDDIVDQGFKFALEPEQAAFMYVSGSWTGAPAQEVIDMDQANMIPFAFDWIKSFAISPAVSGTASTLDALDYHDCNELYFNYAERGWKLIPLTIGMGRINEATTGFVASEDALHGSDLLVYMNAYMMLSSSLGQPFPLLTEITAADIHRGSHTVEAVNQACLIGHDIITELAFLSETGAHVPDSDLAILTDALPQVPWNAPYSYQLTAAGGDAAYTWELISAAGLPGGLSLSSGGLISGSVTEDYGVWNVAFKVTDGTDAFRKVGLTLGIETPEGNMALSAGILADATTDYGVDTVAVMTSAVQTAPDEKATFRIAISVDPMAGASIVSLASGTWGVKSGADDVTRETTFDGNLGESVDSISNIQVVDFNANGGGLTMDAILDLSFQSVAVHSANHGRDRVRVVAGAGTANYTGSALTTDPATIDLQALAGSATVSSFTIANGSANSSNRWNVGSIQVNYTVRMPSDDGYVNWAADYGFAAHDAQADADAENGGAGDGYANLLEFALGMDPTVSDAGSQESIATEEEGASTYFSYAYERRTGYLDLGLTYTLIVTPDLVTQSAELPFDVTIGDPVDGFQTITTRYLIEDAAKFIQLQVDVD